MTESFPYIYKGKSKDAIKQFIKSETGIEISNLLNKYIANPTLVHTANKQTLLLLIEEFEPIYQKYIGILDGPNEIGEIKIFGFFLKSRIERIPELQQYLM